MVGDVAWVWLAPPCASFTVAPCETLIVVVPCVPMVAHKVMRLPLRYF